jgi:acyl carrier protein
LTDAEHQRLARLGLAPVTEADGLALLDAAAADGRSLLVPLHLDRAALRRQPGAGLPPILADLLAGPGAGRPSRRLAGTPESAGRNDFAARLAALDPDDREAAVRDVVLAEAALVLGMSGPGAVAAGRSFRELGFDSLTAVELRNRLGGTTGLRLPATVVFDHPTPEAMSAFLGAQLGGSTAEETTVLAAFAGLEKIESSLGQILEDDAVRSKVTARVQKLLAQLSVVAGAAEDSVADRIQSADDDDIFDFIDQEFGV